MTRHSKNNTTIKIKGKSAGNVMLQNAVELSTHCTSSQLSVQLPKFYYILPIDNLAIFWK